MAGQSEKPLILIPARRDSKGVAFKNRHLLRYTLGTIPPEWRPQVVISTNDEVIIEEVGKSYASCRIHHRSNSSALDTATTKECVSEVIRDLSITGPVVMLYLTYPQREWRQVMDAWNWYQERPEKSLLCREEVESHPYLCLYEQPNYRGSQVVEHDLCRRQDYPAIFKICHMISIFDSEEVENLNNNLYNNDTIYYKIPRAIDIDTTADLKKFHEEEPNG